MSRARDLGAMAGGASLAGLGCQMATAGVLAEMPWPEAISWFWCGLVPLALSAALLGTLGPVARRLAARGGSPVLVLSAALCVHVSLAAVAGMVQLGGERGDPAALVATAFPTLLAMAGCLMLLRACGARPAPLPTAGPGDGPADGAEGSQAVARSPSYHPAAAGLGAASLLAGLAIVLLVVLVHGEPRGPMIFAGAALALAGGSAGFTRAIGGPGREAVGMAALMVFPAALWGLAGVTAWVLAPLAFGFSLPLALLAVTVRTRARAHRSPGSATTRAPRGRSPRVHFH